MFSDTILRLTGVAETDISAFPELLGMLADFFSDRDQELVHLTASTDDEPKLILTILSHLFRGHESNIQCFAYSTQSRRMQPCTLQRWNTEEGVQYQLI